METELNEAEKVVPDDLSPYWSIARVLVDNGKEFDRAETYIKKYLAGAAGDRSPTARLRALDARASCTRSSAANRMRSHNWRKSVATEARL